MSITAKLKKVFKQRPLDIHSTLHVKTLYDINLVKNAENQLVQAYRDINMVHAYVNTPATAKLAIEV